MRGVYARTEWLGTVVSRGHSMGSAIPCAGKRMATGSSHRNQRPGHDLHSFTRASRDRFLPRRTVDEAHAWRPNRGPDVGEELQDAAVAGAVSAYTQAVGSV